METKSDLLRLWAIQAERRKQWLSMQGTFLLTVFAAPIVLAIMRQEAHQLLKLGYPLIGIVIAISFNQIGSATSVFSALVSSAIGLLILSITLPIAQRILSMTPNPGWYITVIPLYVFINAMNETFIPIKERIEWEKSKANISLSDNDVQVALNKVTPADRYANKTHANITTAKDETIWEKISRSVNKRRGLTRSNHITKDLQMKTYMPSSQNQRKSNIDLELQNSRDFNDLQHLLKQADESMQRIKPNPIPSLDIQSTQPVSTISNRQDTRMEPPETGQARLVVGVKSSQDDATVLAQEYQMAFVRNDRLALFRMTTHELILTEVSEERLIRSSTSNFPTQLEVVVTGGSYLLIQRDNHHWLVPTFQNMKSLETSQPAKGIFVYTRENISAPELRLAAEVKQVGGLWEVVATGQVAVPV